MKKIVIPVLFIIIAVTSLVYWFIVNTRPLSQKSEVVDFSVPAGASATQIGSLLYSKNLIKSPLAFKIYIQFFGKAGSIQAGDYKLTPSLNLFEIVESLGHSASDVRVTIPEGFRREEVAVKIATALQKEDGFIKVFMDESEEQEGYLFPDTYNFSKNATAGAIIAKMKSNFSAKTANLRNNTDLNERELLIMASLIERETKLGSERPIVAGIIFNRLKSDWPLQIDATVQYALASVRCRNNMEKCDWWQTPLLADLEISSPYNTYKQKGLPPAPIANPGLTALKAAYAPEESDYYFYIHDPEGKIHFAKTVEEQNDNVRKYLR